MCNGIQKGGCAIESGGRGDADAGELVENGELIIYSSGS